MSDKSNQKAPKKKAPSKKTKPDRMSIEHVARDIWNDYQSDCDDDRPSWMRLVDNLKKYEIDSEINKLQKDQTNLIQNILNAKDKKDDEEKYREEIEKLEQNIKALNHKRDIQYLLDSVKPKAHSIIEKDKKFRELFTANEEVNSFVVSVDIRRSTELMLKARSPKLFADFITTLCGDLENIFKKNYAVVDKFTGDGILAFFPEFFSGEDSGYLTLKASKEANEAFDKIYKKFRSSFSTVLKDVGLGIGIDYGKVHQVRMAGAFTIVGQPVVYACRLSGAPANKIFINQPAYEIITDKYPHLTIIEETSIEIKSEGSLICYDTRLTNKAYTIKPPDWKK